MLGLGMARRMEMGRTELGLEAATVRPAGRPAWMVTAAKRTAKRPQRLRARAESSGRVSVVGTKGLKVGLVAADVAMVMRLPLARALVQLGWECISGGAEGVELVLRMGWDELMCV